MKDIENPPFLPVSKAPNKRKQTKEDKLRILNPLNIHEWGRTALHPQAHNQPT